MILFLGGLAGTVHETLLVQNDRPTLLILFAAMMGLPAFLAPTEKEGVKFGTDEEREHNRIEQREQWSHGSKNDDDKPSGFISG